MSCEEISLAGIVQKFIPDAKEIRFADMLCQIASDILLVEYRNGF